LHGGALVATTDELLRASGLPHDLLELTGVRTPLGGVLIARLRGSGTVEVAGPSAAADVRAVSDAMLAHGAEQVLIDGAVDRRAASSPEVSEGLVISTGAVLSRDLGEVVRLTADAVELVRLPTLEDDGALPAERLRALAGHSALLGAEGDPVELDPRFVLTADGAAVAGLLAQSPQACWLTVAGALPESFVAELGSALRRSGRELSLIVADSTRVFLARRGPEFYARQGVHIISRRPISLRALTVNPVAPRSHSFDSAQLREALARAVPEVAIFDVMDPGYAAPGTER
jgi:hypothetical protein